MKKFIALLFIIVVFCFSAVGCSNNDENADSTGSKDDGKVYKIKCAGIYAPEYPITVSLNRAADIIREKTGGKVDIKVYPNNQLGDWSTVYEEVMKGTIGMASCMVGTSFDERFEMLMIPYLANDYETSLRVFSPGSNYYESLESVYEDGGVQLLNIYLDGYMGIGATKIADDGLMDPEVQKGLTYRCPGTKSAIASAKGLGYMYSTIPYAETYTAIQTGIVDGWMGGPAYLNNQGFSDVIKYFVDMRYCMEPQPTFINAELLNSMPEEYQQIIMETFAEEGRRVAIERESVDNQALEDLKAKGITIITPTEEEIANIADYFHEYIWPDLTDSLGDEILQGMLKDVEGK